MLMWCRLSPDESVGITCGKASGSIQYPDMVDTISRYRRVFRYRGIAPLIRPCCAVDTPLLRRRYAHVVPLIRPCCVVDTPLLIARFFPLRDTLVRNANRLYGKEAYSHFRVCFRLFIAIERFAMASHSFPIRFTFGSHLRSSCCRPIRGDVLV